MTRLCIFFGSPPSCPSSLRNGFDFFKRAKLVERAKLFFAILPSLSRCNLFVVGVVVVPDTRSSTSPQ